MALPDDAIAKRGWTRDDVLSAAVVKGDFKVTAIFPHRAMEIARRGMVKYRKALAGLAKIRTRI